MARDKNNPDRRVWECPVCGGVNVWNGDDCERLEAKSIRAAVAHGSCFDNVCGHCGADVVRADSPIMSPCYTHSED